MTVSRYVSQVIKAHDTSDGDGVKIRRVHGFNNPAFSPFLMIDELKSDDEKDYVGGFPPHPHRGIETLTYMLEGHFQHRDHMGNVGELRSGGAQWMASGRGVIHSEMPIMQQGQLHGFQIWINQPAKNKMIPAQYYDYQPETIVERRTETSGLIRMIAGTVNVDEQQLTGPLTNTGVPLAVADWRAHALQKVNIQTPSHHNAMVYVYKGEIQIAGKTVGQGELVLLSQGEEIELLANDDSGALVFSGTPIEEPVVHYGPFVMNSMQEIEQAIHDYNTGVFETY
ncbi:pirin family protein [Vibrio sp. ZSDZ34]|uniref:Pirin family protein n=1 Tax=Vibrio gelatinilyticus TaxID=2893468 RepID=A0A9X1W9C4_9VIBR|nr:pirin family protein [Vibrio gelatinilyticus]MCJ2376156.1 pirin family protein [Vibrio gelatinilyticus]